MKPETLFSLANALVVPAWLLLVVAPRWRWTARVIGPVVFPAILGLLYVVLLVGAWGSAEGGFGSLAQVRRLFDTPWLLLAGWVHYLAFDLVVGSWEVRDAQRLEVPHLLLVPCLVLTFLFGPAGLILYLLLRAVLRRTLDVQDGMPPPRNAG